MLFRSSVDYTIAMRTSRLQLVANAIDGGASAGFLRLLDSSGTTLSSFQLQRPVGVVANSVLVFDGLPLIDPAATVAGTATRARVEDSGGNIVISGLAVGGPNPDIFLGPTNAIAVGQTLAITAATITGN